MFFLRPSPAPFASSWNFTRVWAKTKETGVLCVRRKKITLGDGMECVDFWGQKSNPHNVNHLHFEVKTCFRVRVRFKEMNVSQCILL